MDQLALRYARSGLPGWGRVLRWAGIVGPRAGDRWDGAGTSRLVLNRGLGLDLDLSKPNERLIFYTGRFAEEQALEILLDHCLAAGETFIDVGANIGFITLFAAAKVTKTGRVIAFEPNPELVERLHSTVRTNGLTNVEIHGCALGSEPGELPLVVTRGLSITGTLAVGGEGEATDQRHYVPVSRGDDLLDAADDTPVVVKVDVEGFEPRVFAGMPEFLKKRQPLLVAETRDELLGKAGGCATELDTQLAEFGYTPLGLDLRRAGLGRRLTLDPVTGDRPENTVYLPPGGFFRNRLRGFF